MFDSIESYVFFKKWVYSKMPHGESIELQDDKELLARRITEARALVRAGVDALNERQRTFLVDAVEEQANVNVTSVDIARTVLERLTEIVTTKQMMVREVPDLTARITTANAAIPDALTNETESLRKLAENAGTAVANITSDPTLSQARSLVEGVEEARRIIMADVTRRSKALAEMGADDLNKAAEKLGTGLLSALVDVMHPPFGTLFDESTISLDELLGVLNGPCGGDVAMLGALLETGCGRDPVKLHDFAVAFPQGSDQQKALSTLIETGGFKQNPKALGAVLSVGCGGDPAKLATFVAGFSDADDCARLEGLLTDGGLGAAPDALAHVVATGGADMVKSLGTNFNDPADLAKLDKLVRIGGMGGATSRSPDVLAKMLEHGVASPADLKKLHDNFAPDNMGDLRKMLSALDLRPPPDRDPGKQYNNVSEQVKAPPLSIKTEFFDVVDKGGRSAASEALLREAVQRPSVATMLEDTAKSTDPDTTRARGATYAGAMALSALQGVPNVPPAAKDLLTDALDAAAKATGTAAKLAPLTADPVAAQTAAKDSVLKALEDAGTEATPEAISRKSEEAKQAAITAKQAAVQAAQALNTANPKTKVLIDAAEDAAAKALAKAQACPDDTERAATLTAGMDCVKAVEAALQAAQTAAVTAAKTASKTESMTSSDAAKTACTTNTGGRKALYDTMVEKRNELEEFDVESTGMAVLEAQMDYDAAQQAFDTASQARTQAMARMNTSADNAAQLVITEKMIANPAVLAAQAEAERLAKIAEAPGATIEDKQAALDAKQTAAKALSDAMTADLTVQINGVQAPSGQASGMSPADMADADALYAAAIGLKATLSSTLSWSEAAIEAYRAQKVITEKAQKLAGLPGATSGETTAATTEDTKLQALKQRVEDAKAALTTIGGQASDLDKKITKNVKVNKSYLRHLQGPPAASAPDIATQQTKHDNVVEAAAMCAAIAKRSQSFGFPAMGRDELIGIASTMEKSDTTGIPEHDNLGGGKEADTLHFCGRHTREFFGFEGRDFFPEDFIMDAAIERASDGNTNGGFPICMMKTTSLWPTGFGEADVRNCMNLAIAEVENVITQPTLYAEVAAQSNNRKRWSVTINYNGQDYDVNIAFTATANVTDTPNLTIGQFVPTSTPSVPFFDMHTIKSAMKY